MTPNTRTLKGQSYCSQRWANPAWPKGSKSRGFSNDEETYTNKASQKLKEGEIDKFKPQYLWEDLFGNASIFEKGLSIVWVDNEDYNKVRIKSSARINVPIIEGEETDRMWRYTNLDASM